MEALSGFLRENRVEIAMLAIPKASIKAVADSLIEKGVRGLWNFSYADIDAPAGVVIENVHLIDSLMTLSYRLAAANGKSGIE
jgi:redox-sensing transcriptional repressor